MTGSEHAPTGVVMAVWVSTMPRDEASALVRFLTPDGALLASARSLLKPSSKLAPLLKPGDELTLDLARGRGATPVLTGVHPLHPHPVWQRTLNHTALCWYMTEYTFISGGDPVLNQSLYQLVVNLLRSEPAAEHLPSALCMFCLRLLALHGMRLDLTHCAISGALLGPGEPVHLLPSGEGLVGREAYNAHYARTGGGMPRFEPGRLERWRACLRLPLLEYPALVADSVDCSLLVHLVKQQVAHAAGQRTGSDEFLTRQWRLPSWAELVGPPGQ